MNFNSKELQRYHRHFLVNECGVSGQIKLKRANVLVIGAGGLGCPCLIYLASCGIGNISVIDFDVVQLSNLPRQVLYGEEDIGQKKVDVLKKVLSKLNSNTKYEFYSCAFNENWANQYLDQFDLVIDGTDNFKTRLLVNRLCVQYLKPLLTGALDVNHGTLGLFWVKKTPCLNCLYPNLRSTSPGENCSQGGIIAPFAGMMGTMLASWAIKFILGQGQLLTQRLIVFDFQNWQMQQFEFKRNVDCSVCAPAYNKLKNELEDLNYQSPNNIPKMTIKKFKEKILFKKNRWIIIDVRNLQEIQNKSLFFLGNKKVNIPLEQIYLKIDKIKLIQKQFPQIHFFILCQRGIRAQVAAQILKEEKVNHLFVFSHQ